jgi:Tfp pilus assembly protein PilE
MRTFGLLGVLVVLGVGYFVTQQSVSSGSTQASPQEQIDVIGVRQQLLTIAQAERQYLASHGTYATLEQLAQEELLPGGTDVRGYRFTVVADGSSGFVVTATPSDEQKAEWPVLEIDERMQVARQ